MTLFRKLCYPKQLKKYSTFRNVIGIETSCDDTAVGLVSSERKIIAESKYNQFVIHKKQGSSKQKGKYTSWPGGVIPDLAKRLHHDNLIYAVSDCIEKNGNTWENIDALALTIKPGLEPCLWEGIKFSILLLKKYKIPFIPIHHMEAHALTSRLFDQNIKYPFLTLLVSGGHCLIALVESFDKFYKLGESIDISPGNCIDKISRQLGLYETSKYDCSSGGALMEKYAINGDDSSYPTMTNMIKNYCHKNKDCNFSYTGLLAFTHRLIDKSIETDYQNIEIDGCEKRFLSDQTLSNICASVQKAISIQLNDRLKRSIIYLKYKNVKIENLVVSGGVASNLYIRNSISKLANELGLVVSCPPVSYCTDNGVMIAWNGCEKLMYNSKDIIYPNEQTENFFKSIKPQGKAEFGVDLTNKIKQLNIKN
ncbi:unnamed protein product [Brachionus calyciflorus]|uniref:N(6)-L-threonylcarbamoyladenine synthase n=1 Tax=Brachionus calyciflorus TaxID=104777 RepID=A0A813YN90_9BILA|nr:unnamed protein product [Brachionus calyciflorus]